MFNRYVNAESPLDMNYVRVMRAVYDFDISLNSDCSADMYYFCLGVGQ